MDVKMDVGNVLDGAHESLHNAAMWLRAHLNIPANCTIFKEFEEYFNCRIEVDDRRDSWLQPTLVVFTTSAEVTAFVLRWS